MSDKIDRRSFIAGAASTGLFTASSYARISGANERIQMAIIGAGGRGQGVMRSFLKVSDQVEFIAVEFIVVIEFLLQLLDLDQGFVGFKQAAAEFGIGMQFGIGDFPFVPVPQFVVEREVQPDERFGSMPHLADPSFLRERQPVFTVLAVG